MTPLTKEQVEKLRPAESVPNSAAEMRYADDIRGLCDLALQSLSLESVRSRARNAALEEVVNRLGKEYLQTNNECDGAYNNAVGYCIGAVVALQSPARMAEGGEHIYTKSDMEAACALVLAGFRSKPMLDKMVDRFLAWPLPFSVCADLIATRQEYGRIGTNLLSAIEARQMLEHVLAMTPESPAKEQDEILND